MAREKETIGAKDVGTMPLNDENPKAATNEQQKPQRQNLATQAAQLCADLRKTLGQLQGLADRRPFLGNFEEADFVGTDLSYMDPATLGTLFDFVVPSLMTNYNDAANGGRNKQVINQVSRT